MQTSLRPPGAMPQKQIVPLSGSFTSIPAHPEDVQPSTRLAPPQMYAEEGLEKCFSPMNNLLYGPKPLAERSNNAGMPRATSYTDAPHELESPPQSAHQPSNPAGLPTSGSLVASSAKDNALGPVSMAVSPAEGSLTELSLEEYAAQNKSDREETLAQFMIENLENPAFTTLCEDVENCWQRIALGL